MDYSRTKVYSSYYWIRTIKNSEIENDFERQNN